MAKGSEKQSNSGAEEPAVKKVGRRPGNEETRTVILDAACELFGNRGYDSTTIRAVAAEADVDPALVMHYFKNKAGLFDAVLGEMGPFTQRLSDFKRAEKVDARQLAEFYLSQWEDPVLGPRMKALVRAGLGSEHALERLRAQLSKQIELFVGGAGVNRERIPFAMASLMGIAVSRHLVGLKVTSEASRAEIVDIMTPALEAILEN